MPAKDRPFARLAAEMAFGKEGVERLDKGHCPRCGVDTAGMNFRNQRSADEHGISGLCQKCQDDTFTPSDDEERD